MIVSIVIPCYNEEENIEAFYNEFIKVFKTIGGKNMFSIYDNLTLEERGILMGLILFTEWGTNRVIVNGSIPAKKDLFKYFKISNNTFYKLIQSLIKKNMIKTFEENKRSPYIDIYINPHILAMGDEMDENTIKMFGEKSEHKKQEELPVEERNWTYWN